MDDDQGPPPIMLQPGPVSAPETVPVGVPPGLEYLTQVGKSSDAKRQLDAATPVYRGFLGKSQIG